jgi:hypothetical protein
MAALAGLFAELTTRAHFLEDTLSKMNDSLAFRLFAKQKTAFKSITQQCLYSGRDKRTLINIVHSMAANEKTTANLIAKIDRYARKLPNPELISFKEDELIPTTASDFVELGLQFRNAAQCLADTYTRMKTGPVKSYNVMGDKVVTFEYQDYRDAKKGKERGFVKYLKNEAVWNQIQSHLEAFKNHLEENDVRGKALAKVVTVAKKMELKAAKKFGP